ncbi:synaptophysin [Ixodes scapularis]
MDLNFRVLKEPRGFMRVLQFVFAIFAFATTSGFGSATTFKVSCGPESEPPVTVNFQFGYPFRMSYFPFEAPAKCTAGHFVGGWTTVRLPFNFASNAEFFVATGVLSFLYCVGILGIYLFSNKMYIENQTVPIIDLGLSALLALFWFAGSSAWAQGKSDVKYYTSLPNFKNFVDVCKMLSAAPKQPQVLPPSTFRSSWASSMSSSGWPAAGSSSRRPPSTPSASLLLSGAAGCPRSPSRTHSTPHSHLPPSKAPPSEPSTEPQPVKFPTTTSGVALLLG